MMCSESIVPGQQHYLYSKWKGSLTMKSLSGIAPGGSANMVIKKEISPQASKPHTTLSSGTTVNLFLI